MRLHGRYSMKRLIPLLVLLILLSGCATAPNNVLSSLPGEGQGQTDTHGKFQDYTDYGKYIYPELCDEALGCNPYFRKVRAEDIPLICSYLENYESWVTLARECDDCSLGEHYDFDPEIIQEGDWFYLDSDATFDEYSLYYICMNTKTVYYFHNNI